MRRIAVSSIRDAVAAMCRRAAFRMEPAALRLLRRAARTERMPRAREILRQLLENERLARRGRAPLCQDTGTACVYLEIGQEVALTGGSLRRAVDAGVRAGYRALRKSVVASPLARRNTGSNAPATLHVDVVPGRRVRIRFLAKGGGSENCSTVMMLPPAAGREGIVSSVVDFVVGCDGRPCPPVVVGVGIGGTFDRCARIAKRAHLRTTGASSRDPLLASLERELLRKINESGVGPMGLGGKTTALAVHAVADPCHIASLPLAVSLNCHSIRKGNALL